MCDGDQNPQRNNHIQLHDGAHLHLITEYVLSPSAKRSYCPLNTPTNFCMWASDSARAPNFTSSLRLGLWQRRIFDPLMRNDLSARSDCRRLMDPGVLDVHQNNLFCYYSIRKKSDKLVSVGKKPCSSNTSHKICTVKHNPDLQRHSKGVHCFLLSDFRSFLHIWIFVCFVCSVSRTL